MTLSVPGWSCKLEMTTKLVALWMLFVFGTTILVLGTVMGRNKTTKKPEVKSETDQ